MQLVDAIQLTAPAPESVRGVTAQTVGVPGIRQYFYWIVTHYPIGATVGGPFPVRNASSALDSTNYVLVTGEASLGAVSYDVLRTDTEQFPSAPGNYALATGLARPQWRDEAAGGAAPGFYDPAGLPSGAPVSCIVRLNNRDYASPTLELPCAIKVSTIVFPDGSEQNTAGGGGGEAQTPWLSDIDAAGHQLHNLGGQLIVNGGIDAGAESFFNTINVSNSLYVESASSAYSVNVTGDVDITGVYRINGVPLSTGQPQTPWASNIDAANFALSNASGIGIGTAPTASFPFRLLTTQTSGYSAYITNTNPAGTAVIGLGVDTAGLTIGIGASGYGPFPSQAYLQSDDVPFIFRIGGASRLVITTAGNVGIGTATPGSRLSIVGLPTSAAGLSPGDVWNNGGVLNIA